MERTVTEDIGDALDTAARRIADGVVAGVAPGLLRIAAPALGAAALVTARAFAAALGQSTARIAARARHERRRTAAVVR